MNEQRAHDVELLYVEDDAITREEIARYLARRVREVRMAKDGAEGVVQFRTRPADIIITDIRMPNMDGLTMARAIRAENKGVPIIVTTAHSDASFMQDAIDIGVDQYVIKPVAMDKLEAALAKCVEIIEYRRAHKRFLAEREKLIADLQNALAQVKQLSGFLPICSSCKKIRNDEGYWTQIEAYIRDHSEAEFTHSICPECATRIYGKYYTGEK